MVDEQRLIGPKNKVFAHDDAQGVSRANGERRLHVDVLACQVLPDLVDAVLGTLAGRYDNLSLPSIAIGRSEFCADSDQG